MVFFGIVIVVRCPIEATLDEKSLEAKSLKKFQKKKVKKRKKLKSLKKEKILNSAFKFSFCLFGKIAEDPNHSFRQN